MIGLSVSENVLICQSVCQNVILSSSCPLPCLAVQSVEDNEELGCDAEHELDQEPEPTLTPKPQPKQKPKPGELTICDDLLLLCEIFIGGR